MSATATDVSTAGSFDAGAFFNNLLNTAGTVYAATRSPAPAQNTGAPGVSTNPNLRASPGGTAQPSAGGTGGALGGLNVTTLAVIGAALVGVYLIARK